MTMVENTNTGTYILSEGETPSQVSLTVYGDTYKVPLLLKENSDIEWKSGESVVIPNKKGKTTVVQEGETTNSLLARMFSGQPTYLYVQLYLKWNAGIIAEELVGREVFVPER